jgi:hypothetical protein
MHLYLLFQGGYFCNSCPSKDKFAQQTRLYLMRLYKHRLGLIPIKSLTTKLYRCVFECLLFATLPIRRNQEFQMLFLFVQKPVQILSLQLQRSVVWFSSFNYLWWQVRCCCEKFVALELISFSIPTFFAPIFNLSSLHRAVPIDLKE